MSLLSFTFKNLEPIKIVNLDTSNTNEESTLNYIPGSSIKGLILNALLDHPDFEDIKKKLLSSDTSFYNAYPIYKGKELIPSLKGFYETKAEEGNLDNMFTTKKFDSGKKRAKLGQFGYVENGTFNYLSVDLEDSLNINISQVNMYRSEGIVPGYTFKSYIQIDNDDNRYMDIVKAVLETKSLRLGNSRTSGNGKVEKISVKEESQRPYASYSLANANQEKQVYLVVLSPMTMRNQYSEACGLNEAKLKQLLGVTNLQVDKASSSVIKVSGYNRTWGTRTPEYTMYDKGSVFKMTFDGTLTSEKMLEIETSGLGVGKNDGFGKVLFIKDFEKINQKKKIDFVRETVKKSCNMAISNDTVNKQVELISQGLVNKKIDKAITSYIIKHSHIPGGASKSQAGTVLMMAKSYQYRPGQAIKAFDEYKDHAIEKVDNQRKQTGVYHNQKDFLEYIELLLNDKLKDTLGLDDSIKLDANKEIVYKLKLIEQLITYANRKGKK